MGLFLVFFSAKKSAATSVVEESSNIYIPTSTKPIKRTNSINPIITKTQSTLSICSILLFFTLILFINITEYPSLTTPRRLLQYKHKNRAVSVSFALQGMGKLYRRGTRAMIDIVVAHVVEDTNEDQFRLFLKVLHRSGITSRADVAFIFGSSLFESRFNKVIQEENDSFMKLVHFYRELNRMSGDSAVGLTSFDLTRFVKRNGSGKEMKEALWGKKIRVPGNDSVGSDELTRLSYGSVVGFEASELDPENSLGGFLEHVPMSLRRWACYPMLLGRVRRNFRHVMLVEVKNLVLLSDPLGRVRNMSSESVYVNIKTSLDKSQRHNNVDSSLAMGGTRGVRRLSNALHTGIVRMAMQNKKKHPIADSTVLNQLATNEHVLKSVKLIKSIEPVSRLGSLDGLKAHRPIVHIGNSSHDLGSIIMKHICSCEVYSLVYSDCGRS